MKRYALLALTLALSCCMLIGCSRREPDKGNMSTPPTEAARPTAEPTTEVTIPTTMPATEPDNMPGSEPMTEDATKSSPKGMLQDPVVK